MSLITNTFTIKYKIQACTKGSKIRSIYFENNVIYSTSKAGYICIINCEFLESKCSMSVKRSIKTPYDVSLNLYNNSAKTCYI